MFPDGLLNFFFQLHGKLEHFASMTILLLILHCLGFQVQRFVLCFVQVACTVPSVLFLLLLRLGVLYGLGAYYCGKFDLPAYIDEL